MKLKKAQASVQECHCVSRPRFTGFRSLNILFCPMFPFLNGDNNLTEASFLSPLKVSTSDLVVWILVCLLLTALSSCQLYLSHISTPMSARPGGAGLCAVRLHALTASFRGRFLSTRRLQFLEMMVPFTRGWAGNLCADHHRNLQIHHLVKPFPYCISQAASENANKGWEKVGENGFSVLHGSSADSPPSHPCPFLASAPGSPLSALSPGHVAISVLWRRGCCSVQPGL